MDSPNSKSLEQAKVLLDQLIERQESLDKYYDRLASVAQMALDLEAKEGRFSGESFMLHHLKLLKELLEKND